MKGTESDEGIREVFSHKIKPWEFCLKEKNNDGYDGDDDDGDNGDNDDDDGGDDDDGDGDSDNNNDNDDDDDYNKTESDIHDNGVDCDANISCFPWRC
nr:PREDICTED: secreted acidic protein 2-like [Megachile rotundata]